MIHRRIAILVALSILLLASQALAAGDTFFTTQCRLMDTRKLLGGPTLGPSEKRIVMVTGSCGVPSDALAVALNIVAVFPSAPGFAVLFAGDAAAPATSVLNFRAGQVRANNAIVALASNASGTIALINASTGATDYVIDIAGYFKTACPTITPPTIATMNPQTFTVSGSSGTFTLTFNGQTTTSLAFDATAAEVQAALNALSSIGGMGGSTAVTGTFDPLFGVGFYTVTFGGTLTGPQPQMTASAAGGCTVGVSGPAVQSGSTGNQASGPAGATTYAWTITNGTITSANDIQTITYTAGALGTLTLGLTVTDAAGCPASNSVDVAIIVPPH